MKGQVALPSSRALSAADRETGSGPCDSPQARTDWRRTRSHSDAAGPPHAAGSCSAEQPEHPALGAGQVEGL
jgi:hypothetical protein